MADDYVECHECGHALERHARTTGCTGADGCACPERPTLLEIGDARRRAGLPRRWRRGHI